MAVAVLLLGVAAVGGTLALATYRSDARTAFYAYPVYYQRVTYSGSSRYRAASLEWIDPLHGFAVSSGNELGTPEDLLRRNGYLYDLLHPEMSPARLNLAARVTNAQEYAALQRGGFAAYGRFLLTVRRDALARDRTDGRAILRFEIAYPDLAVRRETIWLDAKTYMVAREQVTLRDGRTYAEQFSGQRVLMPGSLAADFFALPGAKLSPAERVVKWLTAHVLPRR